MWSHQLSVAPAMQLAECILLPPSAAGHVEHCHLPCRFDHFDAVAEDLQMDSTEALLQTNSLLHESWQVVQDQVSFYVLSAILVTFCWARSGGPCYTQWCPSCCIPWHTSCCALFRVEAVCVVWYWALHHLQHSECLVAPEAGVVNHVLQPDESHPARADLAVASYMLCWVCSMEIKLTRAITAGSMAATIQLLRPLLPYVASTCPDRSHVQ